MKFRVVVRRLSGYGGAEFIALRFANYLHKRGLLEEVVCGVKEVEVPFKVTELGYLKPGRFLKTLSFQKRAVKYLKTKETVNFAFSKVPHCHVYRNGGGTHLGFLEGSLKALPPARRLIKKLTRSLNPVNYFNPILEGEIFRSSKVIIAISSKVKEEVIKFYGRKLLNKIYTVPNPVDLNRFNREAKEKLRKSGRELVGFREGRFVLGFASSNFTLKGLKQLIEALALLPKDVTLAVAGGRNPKSFLKLAEKLGVADRVHFLGKVNRMETFYAGIDLLVHPSFYDTFANVVTEALATGTPVICSRETGAAEFITEGVSGFILKEITPEEIAEKVEAALPKKWDFNVKLPTDEEVFSRYVSLGERSLSRG
ncbi:glycosyltransferase family 4 protein [Thermovibrio ammonificans]